MAQNPIRVGIVGASGYTGAELISLLSRHSHAKIVGLFGSEKQSQQPLLSTIHPRFRGVFEQPVRPASLEALVASELELVFLATPHELSHDLTPSLLQKGLRVIDLSGAFRLPGAQLYPQYYGFAHRYPSLLREAVYGLTELSGGKLKDAKLVANPGCYPTSALLPLKPLLEAGLIEPSEIIIDSISGISGAGRQAKPELHFSEVSARAYGIFTHRHAPEIEAWLGVQVSFVPHIAPFDRGMLSTIHVKTKAGIEEKELRNAWAQAYEGCRFIRQLPAGEWPAVKDVAGTNFCDMALTLEAKTRRLVIVSALDNLLKGASGQAVQNFNAMYGFADWEGIL